MSYPRYEVLRVAMRKIAWPIMTLREYAEDQGHDLEPVMARQLANDANYLRDIAQKAMAEIASIDPAGVNDRHPSPDAAEEIDQVRKVLEQLVGLYDGFCESNGDQAAAYYSMIKGKDKIWIDARAAISNSSGGGK